MANTTLTDNGAQTVTNKTLTTDTDGATWHCDLGSDRVYELDADAPIISTVGSAFLMFV